MRAEEGVPELVSVLTRLKDRAKVEWNKYEQHQAQKEG